MPLNVDKLDAGIVNQSGSPVKPYKVYTALLNQLDENPPVPTVFENTLDFDLVFGYNNQGIYTIKKVGGDFDLDNLWYCLGGLGNLGVAQSGSGYCTISTEGFQLTILSYNNYVDNELINNQLRNVPIEIRVYN